MAGITPLNVGVWMIALLIGMAIGYAYMCHLGVHINKPNKTIHMPGSWFTMMLVLVIFASKYYLGYETGMHPQIIHNVHFISVMMSVSGVCSGLFVGRLSRVLLLLWR